MATLEQIAEAIKRADAAGNAEDVKALGAAYRALQAQAPVDPASVQTLNPYDNGAKRLTGGPGVPQQRYIVFAGPGATEAHGPQDLPPLPRAMLQLAAQEGSTPFFSALREHYGYEHGRLLCSTRGAAVGAKPKFFTGRSDGWLFRQYGYMRSGVAEAGVQSHPKFSPRKVRL